VIPISRLVSPSTSAAFLGSRRKSGQVPKVGVPSHQSALKSQITTGLPVAPQRDERLHLSTSVRSYRCLATTQWVNALLEGRINDAHQIAEGIDDFPICLTRSLEQARCWLLENARGNRRCGLVASSGARRLRADGLGVMLSANELSDVASWYLLPKGDIRSSYALEVAANEYTCQGFELDYVGVCWDGDLLWDHTAGAWKSWRLIGSRWQTVNNPDAKRWAINKYRVLLTRARVGSVIWVPEGSADDPTRDLEARDRIAEVLSKAGAHQLSSRWRLPRPLPGRPIEIPVDSLRQAGGRD
jgi:DUF2075 family protein